MQAQYNTLLQSELHIDTSLIESIIKNNKPFCIYGDYGVGKTTVMMTCLEYMGYEITYINEYKDTPRDTLQNVNCIMSFFTNKPIVIILDDYPFSEVCDSELFIIYISHKRIIKIKSVEIDRPDSYFLNLLAQNIIYLENKNFTFNSEHVNFITFWSDLNFSLEIGKQINSEFFFKPDDREYIKLLDENNITRKLEMSEHVHSYICIQNKIMNKIKSIHDLADALEYMSCANSGTPEYGALSIVAPTIFIRKVKSKSKSNK